MFEKLLQKLLKDVVGEFIDGIDTKKLNIGIWSGTVQIVNVSLKPRLLAMLGLPYRITFSNISRLFITIPWKNLFTAPLVIQIQSIQVLAQNSVYHLSREQQGKVILLKVKQFIQKLARQIAKQKKTEQKSAGYLDNVYLKMLDNLYLTIRNIHFRFEVPRSLKQQPQSKTFSFGVTLQSIQVFAVDEKGNRVFIDRTKLTPDKNIIYKKLKLENFGFYWNYEDKQTILLSLQTQFPVKPNNEKVLKDMLDMKQISAGKGLAKQKINYIIMINAEGLVKQDNRATKPNVKVTKYEISFSIKQIKMILNQKIIKQAFWLFRQATSLSDKKTITNVNNLDKWQGPKNQSFLGLLRKYCISQFWQSDSNNKSNPALTANQQKLLIQYLCQNKQNLDQIQLKAKQIIVGDIGNKNAVIKAGIINNWQSIQAMMSEQKKIQEEAQLQVKFNFIMEELSVFYVDQVKMPIAQLFLKNFKISALQTLQKQLNIQIQIGKLQGFGYDQNPIIRMQHQIQKPFQSPTVVDFSKLFIMTYKYKQSDGQSIQISLGGIGLIYDFKTFRQLYRLSQGLISSQSPPKPTSPASLSSIQLQPLPLARNLSRKQQKDLMTQKTLKQVIKSSRSQITITIQNISLYILQYTKKTWRLSMSGCQLTNSQSFIPENILISAISFSVSDFYVCEPFGAKIVLNFREQNKEISVAIQPIQVKISGQTIKNILKIPSCLETYKKNDAISLSSKYGQIFLFDERGQWRKHDGVIIDGSLYLYQKSDEYSKYQLRVVSAQKKQDSKRQIIQIMVKPDTLRQAQKYMIVIRNASQQEQWLKYLLQLSQVNKKWLAKQQAKLQQIKQKNTNSNQNIDTKTQANSKKNGALNLFVLIQKLCFSALQNETEKDKQPIIGFVVHKAVIQICPAPEDVKKQQKQIIAQSPPPLSSKPQSVQKMQTGRQKTLQSGSEQFKSFNQIKFSHNFSKKINQENSQVFVSIVEPNEPFQVQNQQETDKLKNNVVYIQDNSPGQSIHVQIQDIQYWYKKSRRLTCSGINEIKKQSEQKQNPKSLIINIIKKLYETKVQINIINKVILDYEPYQILQTMAYVNTNIINILSTVPTKQIKQSASSAQILDPLQTSEHELKVPVHRQNILIASLQVKSGIQINCFNLLTYQKSQQKQKILRQKVMRAQVSNLNLKISPTQTKLQTHNLSILWYEGSKQYKIVQTFQKQNYLTLQLLPNKMLVKVYNLFLPDYLHYITMRTIDYILLQLKQAVLYPYNFNEYFDRFGEQNDKNKNIHSRMWRFKNYVENNMTQSQIWQRIKNLFEMQVYVYEAYAFVAPQCYITVGLIRVTNDYVDSFNSSIQDYVLCDQYRVQFKDLNVWMITDRTNININTQNDKQQKNKQVKQKLMKKLSKVRQNFKNNQQTNLNIIKSQQTKQQRFVTVLNRFSNNLTDSQWVDRSKQNLLQVVDTQWPLDMSFTVTMFGKYPQYKTLYPKFETSVSNTSMKIKLVLSQLHISLLPSQIQLFVRIINQILENLSYNDGKNEFNYDERIYKKLYKEEVQKNNKMIEQNKNNQILKNKMKIVLDPKGQAMITSPLKKILKQEQYMHSPMQFTLNTKSASLRAVILPTVILNRIKSQQKTMKMIERKTQKMFESKNQQPAINGIQIDITSFSIQYLQYPNVQTKVAFCLLQVMHVARDLKTKILELTSAAQRQSRETMFIDNTKKQMSRVDLFKSQANFSAFKGQNVNNTQQKSKIGKEGESAIKMEKNLSQSKLNTFQNIEKTKQNQQQALSLKMYTKINQNIKTQQIKKESQVYKVTELRVHNMGLTYDPVFINLLFKLVSSVEKQKKQHDQLIKNKPQSMLIQPPSPKSQIICRFDNFIIKIPLPQQSARQVQVSQTNYIKNYKFYDTLCILLKCNINVQMPKIMPVKVDLDYVEAYMQQNYQQNQDGDRSKSNAMKSQEKINIYQVKKNSNLIKNKRKTLLQPTRLYYKKRISQELISKTKKKQQQQQTNLMASRIKSMLKLSPSQPQLPSLQQKQVVSTMVILNQISIDKMFIKASIQDVKVLLKMAGSLSTQISTYFPQKIAEKQSSSEIKKNEKQKQTDTSKNVNKKTSLEQLIQVQNDKSPKQKRNQNQNIQLPTLNKVQLKPLQLVIMNDLNFANTPLIYAKLQINNYQSDQFNLQLIANYFNLRVNAWEPLIERCLLLIKTSPFLFVQKMKQNKENKEQKQEKQKQAVVKNSKQSAQITQKQKINLPININISTNFLQALIPALRNKNCDLSIKRLSQTKSVGDEVNCWMLINQLGYDISCESKSFRSNKMVYTVNIPNNKTKKLTFLNDVSQGQGFQTFVMSQNEDEINGPENDKKNRQTISIIINNEFKIKEIDIGQIGVKKLCFNYQGHPYWIYGHTYVDISKNVKYIKFYSQVQVINSTNLDLWVKLPMKHQIENLQNKKQQNDKFEMTKKLSLKNVSNQNDNKKENGKQSEEGRSQQRKLSHNFNLREDLTNNLKINSPKKRNKSDNVSDSDEQNQKNERLQASFRMDKGTRPNYIKIPANKQASLAFDLDQNFKKLSQSQFSSIISREPFNQKAQSIIQQKQALSSYQKIQKLYQFQIQKQRKKMRTIYKILPSGKIINKLPQIVNLALKVQDHILYAYTMIQDQSQFIYTNFNNLEISIHVDGYQWSQFVPCSVLQGITLQDFNDNKLNIKVNMFVDEDGVTNAIIYPIAVLYNDSDYILLIKDPQSKTHSYFKNQPKKAISLSNNRVLVLKPDLPQTTGYTSKQTSFMKIYMNQDEISCKFQINSLINKAVQQKQIQHVPPIAYQTLLINQLILKTANSSNTVNQGINTKFVTVSHKYYFDNETEHTILVRKYTGGADSSSFTTANSTRSKSSNFAVRSYSPYSVQSFWLFQEDYLTTKQTLSYYELTIKNSPYEWSGALSINKPGNNTFILRNRGHFNDVLFLNLLIIKYHGIQKFKIILKVLSKQQVPYIIRNQWPGFVIKLPQYGNIVLREGEQIQYGWDEPVLKSKYIPILVGHMQKGVSLDKINYSRIQIKAQNPQQNDLIKLKKLAQIGQISYTQNQQTKYFEIREYQKPQRKTQKQTVQIDLPLRIALINNSFNPVYHLLDFSSNVLLKVSNVFQQTIVRLNLDSIQLDNQSRYRVYFPVVMSTSLSVTANIGKNIQVQVGAQPILLNIQQDFGKDLYATAMIVSALLNQNNGMKSQLNRIQNQAQPINTNSLISKLTLPEVVIKLQVKTKKLSIETTVNLQKPAVTKYPWHSFPYPIKNIAITLLSHLSISPWALISSFQKGVVSLLTQQQSAKGIQSFFGQIIAALSNSVSGLMGIIVGHDIERVDNFFDGIEQGSNLLFQQISQIKDSFQPQECTLPSILTSLGYGMISIVLKPMKGVLQMTLKITQGIKKTALYSFEGSQNKFRQRDAIVFYGQQQKFKTYDSNQSQLMIMLLKICGQPLKYFHLVKFFTIVNKLTNNIDILSIGNESVILFNARTQKLIWQLNLHEVNSIQLIRYTCIRFSPMLYEVDAFHQDIADQIYTLLLRLHKKVFVKP